MPPLSLTEIKDRALAFSREWEGERSESAETQTFWNEFFNVFGVYRRLLASFEEPVKRARKRFEEKGGKGGFIDLLWKGMLIAEHKSGSKDLYSAYQQALEYFKDWPNATCHVTSSYPIEHITCTALEKC